MLGHRSASRLLGCALVGALAVLGLQGTAQAAVPDAPTGLSPSGGDTSSGIPTLSWNRSPGATAYDVQVSADSGFGTIAWSTSTVNSQAVPTAQVPQGTDFWRVRAKIGSSVSAWATDSFTRSNLTAPTLQSPLTGDPDLQEPDNPPVLSWSPVPGAVELLGAGQHGRLVRRHQRHHVVQHQDHLAGRVDAQGAEHLLLAGPGLARRRADDTLGGPGVLHAQGVGGSFARRPDPELTHDERAGRRARLEAGAGRCDVRHRDQHRPGLPDPR